MWYAVLAWGMATTRERILEAACGIARRSGLRAVTVRAVATTTGVGMGTLRHHFPSQGGLHVAVLERMLGEDIDESRLQEPSLTPAERLTACLQQFLPEEPWRQQMWFDMHRAGTGPEASGATREHLAGVTRRRRTLVEAWLTRLVDDGARLRARERTSRFRPAADPLDVTEAALMLTSVVSGLCLDVLTEGSGVTVDQARSLLARVVEDLIS